jgi:hypothetical protein
LFLPKIHLPEDINKITEAAYFLNNKEVVLGGSCADFFLLKKTNAACKDIDFIITSFNSLTCNTVFFIKNNDKNYGKIFLTLDVITNHCVEIFEDSALVRGKDSFVCEYSFECETPQHRYCFLSKMYNNAKGYRKKKNKIANLLNQYEALYGIF